MDRRAYFNNFRVKEWRWDFIDKNQAIALWVINVHKKGIHVLTKKKTEKNNKQKPQNENKNNIIIIIDFEC